VDFNNPNSARGLLPLSTTSVGTTASKGCIGSNRPVAPCGKRAWCQHESSPAVHSTRSIPVTCPCPVGSARYVMVRCLILDQRISDAATLGLPLSVPRRLSPHSRFESSLPANLSSSSASPYGHTASAFRESRRRRLITEVSPSTPLHLQPDRPATSLCISPSCHVPSTTWSRWPCPA
jgi:hypothetical protein